MYMNQILLQTFCFVQLTEPTSFGGVLRIPHGGVDFIASIKGLLDSMGPNMAWASNYADSHIDFLQFKTNQNLKCSLS